MREILTELMVGYSEALITLILFKNNLCHVCRAVIANVSVVFVGQSIIQIKVTVCDNVFVSFVVVIVELQGSGVCVYSC